MTVIITLECFNSFYLAVITYQSLDMGCGAMTGNH